MKTRYSMVLVACLVLLVQGCKVGNVASSQGLTDQAYIYIESETKYPGMVQVTLDNNITFDAKVYQPKKHQVKGETYAVSTGRRRVSVSYGGQLIYERTLMLSTQETNTIILP